MGFDFSDPGGTLIPRLGSTCALVRACRGAFFLKWSECQSATGVFLTAKPDAQAFFVEKDFFKKFAVHLFFYPYDVIL